MPRDQALRPYARVLQVPEADRHACVGRLVGGVLGRLRNDALGQLVGGGCHADAGATVGPARGAQRPAIADHEPGEAAARLRGSGHGRAGRHEQRVAAGAGDHDAARPRLPARCERRKRECVDDIMGAVAVVERDGDRRHREPVVPGRGGRAEVAGVTARSLMLIVTRPKDPGATGRRTTEFPLVGRTATGIYRPTVPSICSRRMSACPAWRPISSTRCTRIQRNVRRCEP